jgi:hypothetical protein
MPYERPTLTDLINQAIQAQSAAQLMPVSELENLI